MIVSEEIPSERSRAVATTAVGGGLINLMLSLIKVAAGMLWHSYALLADGVHSFSDLLSHVLV